MQHAVGVFAREQLWKQICRVDGLNESSRFPAYDFKKGYAL